EVIDAFLLHQPADEVEVCLAILHAVFPLRISPAQLEFIILETVALKDLLNDVRHFFFLENAAIGSAREKPKPGNQSRPVVYISPFLRRLNKPADIAVEE